MTVEPRRSTGPGCSEGVLSPEFPEIQVKVSASFAHDAGMISDIESIEVAGTPCQQNQVLQALVAARKGWSRSGGSSEGEVKATLHAYQEAWGAVLEYSGRVTSETAPEDLERHLYRSQALGQPQTKAPGFEDVPDYHPPRVGVYALDDGDAIAVASWFQTWDGGNHGTQWAYMVSAYRVSDGSPYKLAPRPGGDRWGTLLPERGAPQPEGPQPVDPKVPRPCHLTRY